MTTLSRVSVNTATYRGLRYLTIGAVATVVYLGGSYIFNKTTGYLGRDDPKIKAQVTQKKVDLRKDFIFKAFESGNYDEVIRRTEDYRRVLAGNEGDYVAGDKIAKMGVEMRVKLAEDVDAKVDSKVKIDDFKGAIEEINRFAGNPLYPTEYMNELLFGLREKADVINPTNIFAKAEMAQRPSEKIVLYRKAEDGFVRLGVNPNKVRDKIVSIHLESMISLPKKDYELTDYQDEIYAKLCQLKTYLTARTDFKPNLSKSLVSRLSGTNTPFVVSCESPVQSTVLFDKLGEVYSLLAVTNGNSMVKSMAERFVRLNIDKMKQVNPKQFGSMAIENLQAAVSVNEKYNVGKGAEILDICINVISKLDTNSGLKPKLIKLVGNRMNWLPESKRKEVKAQLFDASMVESSNAAAK